MNQYMYDGPVMEFDTCVANRWQGSTYAASEKKARSNLDKFLVLSFHDERGRMQHLLR